MKPVTSAVAMRFLGERGATAVEYGLMIALIAMAIFGTVYLLGPNLDAAFDELSDGLTRPGPAPPPVPEPPAPSSVYYEDCDAVREAGADPIRRVIPATGSNSTLMVTGSAASSQRDTPVPVLRRMSVGAAHVAVRISAAWIAGGWTHRPRRG